MGGVVDSVKVETSGPLQLVPESAQIRTAGDTAGSNIPEKVGLGRTGGRKKKCGLAPPCAPSEIRNLGESSRAAGAVGRRESLHAAEARSAAVSALRRL